MTDIAEVTSASPTEESAGEQGTQLTSDRRNRKGSGLDSMVLAELKQLAGSLGIKGTGAMRKSQLIDAIRAAQRGTPTPPPSRMAMGKTMARAVKGVRRVRAVRRAQRRRQAT